MVASARNRSIIPKHKQRSLINEVAGPAPTSIKDQILLSFKNFDTVTWDGIIPGGTGIQVQTKTKNEMADGTIIESNWSAEHSEKMFKFDSPETSIAFK